MSLKRFRALLALPLLLLITQSALSQPATALVDRLVKISKDKKTIVVKSDDAPIRKLQIERYNIALEALKQRCKDFQDNLIPLEQVVQAARNCFRAELALKEKPPDRVKLLEGSIGLVRWYEDELEKSVKAGLVPRADLLNLKYDRLGLEIELLQERKLVELGDAK
jgi:hypothetical protein